MTELAVPLREYVEALFARDREALAVASAEREKSAQALAIEREKVAQALAVSFARQIEQGDQALREHIDQQIGQIKAALDSVEKLTGQRHEASERAIAKAEAATERRFDSVNEFRAQLSDQTRTFLPREVADAQFAELSKRTQELAARLDRAEGNRAGSTERRTEQRLSTGLIVGIVSAAVAFLGVLVVVMNLLAG